MDNDTISGSMQENILTLMAWDNQACGIIKSSVDIQLFESKMHREIAHHCVDYHNKFNKSPGEHLPDLLEDVLEEDGKKASLYDRLLRNIYELKDSINSEYVLNTLNKFIRQQQLKIGVTEAAKFIKNGDIDNAELELNKSLNSTLNVFDPGINLIDDSLTALSYTVDDENRILLGIPYFDTIRFGPAPKELMIIVSPPNRGKSWGCIHIAKVAAKQGKKVLIITLEMSQEKYLSRIVQSIFSISKRLPQVEVINIISDNNKFEDFDFIKVKRPVLGDLDILSKIAKKLKLTNNRLSIFVKEFPTGKLSIKGLEVYLNQLERWGNYIPDVLIIDYPDLMVTDSGNLRISIGNIYKEIRGIGVERNIAVVAPSQTNKLGEDASLITMKHLSEDYSKAFTADSIMTYNQTEKEKLLNLARLHIAKNRDEEAGGTVLISQQYHIGQFFLTGSFMPKDYWGDLNNLLEEVDNGND